VEVPDTGGWQRYAITSSKAVRLDAGRQRMRVVFDAAGGVGDAHRHVCDLNWIKIRSSRGPGAGGKAEPSPTPRSPPAKQ
jgi:hypothetical protein